MRPANDTARVEAAGLKHVDLGRARTGAALICPDYDGPLMEIEPSSR